MNTQQRIEALEKELQALKNDIKKDKRPMDYDKYRAANLLQSKTGNKIEILGFLMQIRDEWNKIDEFIIIKDKGYGIFSNYHDRLMPCVGTALFKFKDKPTADLFLETFRPQLETIKEIL